MACAPNDNPCTWSPSDRLPLSKDRMHAKQTQVFSTPLPALSEPAPAAEAAEAAAPLPLGAMPSSTLERAILALQDAQNT